MKWRFIPKEEKFFDMFQDQANHVVKAAKALVNILENYSLETIDTKAAEIRTAEHEGDILCHDIIRKLNQTFVTPFDREDIYSLTTRLDDVLDLIEGTVNRLKMYKIQQVTPELITIAKIVLLSCEEILHAIRKMHELPRIADHCIEINRLENEADLVTRQIIAHLFDNTSNPIEIIKWKEIYEYVELATDKCEDIANILEGIMLKNV
ncbi:MAG: DUF47 family protein [bacterium]|nr:DUF47 family protein [bacterium]